MRKEFKFENRLAHSQMIRQLESIKRELVVLKKRQEYVEDSLLSADDRKALSEARKDLENKNTVPFSGIKRKIL